MTLETLCPIESDHALTKIFFYRDLKILRCFHPVRHLHWSETSDGNMLRQCPAVRSRCRWRRGGGERGSSREDGLLWCSWNLSCYTFIYLFCPQDRASVFDFTIVITLVAVATFPGMSGPMTDDATPPPPPPPPALTPTPTVGLRATVLAKVCNASYLDLRASSSMRIEAFSLASLSTSCCSWAFCFSSSSFWVTRFTRQLAA